MNTATNPTDTNTDTTKPPEVYFSVDSQWKRGEYLEDVHQWLRMIRAGNPARFCCTSATPLPHLWHTELR